MSEAINILYYFEPWVELSRPHLRYHNLRYQMAPQIRDIKKNYPGAVIKVALGEGTLHKCQADRYDLEGCDYVVLGKSELRQFFGNYLSASVSLFNGGDRELSGQYAEYLKSKFEGWQPDVVISFLAPLPDLTGVWPGVSVFYAEFGMFSRAPYPRTFYFDPQGMFRNSTPRQYAAELLDTPVDKDAALLLTDFRENYLYPFYRQRPVLDEELAKAASRFDCKLLLPLQFSGYFGFDCCSSYADQFEFLTDVLDSIPPEIGVFVTEHAGWQEVITEHNIGFLRDRYPNLLWTPHFSKVRAASQYLMAEVDGVITVSSSVGMQCMAWDKPVYSPWDSHLAGFSQVDSLRGISVEKIRSYRKGTYDNAVVQLLTRYYLTEEMAYDSKSFVPFVKEVIAKKEATSFVERMPLLGPPAEVFKKLRDAYREDEGHKLYVQDLGGELGNVVRAAAGGVPEAFGRALKTVDMVSFDLFDTLIDRPFAAPHELFLYMQEQVRHLVGDRSLEFHKLRRYAEHRARLASDRNEVTINEIYDMFFELSDVDPVYRQILIELEWSTELRFCRRRAAGAALYEHAIDQGKQVIAVSDFYYGERELRQLAAKLGYSFTVMHVSSDQMESKKEGGLFKKVVRSLPCEPNKVLHVGDNHQSDIVNAGKHGFKTFHTPKAVDLLKAQPIAKRAWDFLLSRSVFPSDRAQLGQSAFFGLVARRFFDINNGPQHGFGGGDPVKLGYLVLGPMLLAFTQWLVGQVKQNGHSQIYFLSRDGKLLNRVYDLFAAGDSSLPKAQYLLSSRRAYGLASVFEVADAQDLIAIPFEPTSVKKIVESRFAVELTDANCPDSVVESAGLAGLNARVHPVHDMIRMKRLVKLLWPLIQIQAEKEREELNTYLASTGVMSADNAAIVDIGYAGTIQHHLSRLCPDSRFSGYYFMTHAKAEDLREQGHVVNAYYRENVEHHLKKDLLSSHVSLFELLFSSDEQSLVRFEGGAAVTKNEVMNPQRSRLVQLLQRGALQFVGDVVDFFGCDHQRLYYSRDFAVHNIESLITSPVREDALLFNSVSAEDSFSARDARFVIADVAGKLAAHNNRLTKEQAVALITASEWEAGARAILPRPAKETKKAAAAERMWANTLKERQKLPGLLDRPARLYRKFKRDPYQYCSDSKNPMVRSMKRFFA